MGIIRERLREFDRLTARLVLNKPDDFFQRNKKIEETLKN